MPRKKQSSNRVGVPSRALLVRFGASTAEVLGSIPGTIAAPRRELRAPSVTPATFTQVPPGSGEIWAALYDADRKPLSVYAWPLRPRYFGDAPNARSKVPGAMKGGLLKPCFDDRFLHLEVPREAAYLLFIRNRVLPAKEQSHAKSPAKIVIGSGPYGPVQLKPEVLGAYSLRGKAPGYLRRPISFPFPLDPWRRVLPLEVKRIMELIEAWRDRFPIVPRGRIVSEETVLHSGDPSTHFNIVITGDGFKEEELGDFGRLADTVIDGLKSTAPFSDLLNRINIHVIHAASLASGVLSADDTSPVFTDTYYGVRGSWPDSSLPAGYPSYGGYCGITDPGRLYEAAENFAPADQIQLFIMLVNCKDPGGSAFHEQRIAFVTSGNAEISDNYLAWTAEHESAHVIGNLGEEYISPLPWDGVTGFSNLIDRERREEAWWKPFASTDDGKFQYIYDCPDEGSTCELAHNDPYLTASEDPGHLGLYWGAQFVDPDEEIEALWATWEWDSPWRDKRGNNFFRARARCRMRSLQAGWVFCEVCSAEMMRIITDPSV